MNENVKRDKILILTSHYGAGHWQAASAIQSALVSQYPSLETVIIDPEAAFRKFYGMVSHKLFIGTVKRLPYLYDYLYQKTRTPNTLSRFLKGTNHLGIEDFLSWIKSFDPSLIVSTDPVSSGMTAILKKRGAVDIPFITVMTDYAVHSYWVNEEVDQFFVGSESVRQGLWQLGVDDAKIKVTGIPINPKFSRPFNRSALLKKHGLNEEHPVILITGGGYGLFGHDFSIRKLIDVMPCPVQVIIVCGHNHNMYKKMEREIKTISQPIYLKKYVENMEELMAMTDVMITKPGGLSITEAVSMNIPMILYQSLGGHEQENTDYLLAHQAAVFAEGDEDLYRHVAKLIQDPLKRKTLIENMKTIQRTQAAQEAAKLIKAYLPVQAEYPSFSLYQYT